MCVWVSGRKAQFGPICFVESGDPRLILLYALQLWLNYVLPSSNSRYEDEINKRTAAENEFVTLKKVS